MIPIPGPQGGGSSATLTFIIQAPSGGGGQAAGPTYRYNGGPGGLGVATFNKSDLTTPLKVWPGKGGQGVSGSFSGGSWATYGGNGSAGGGAYTGGGEGADFGGVFDNNTINQANALMVVAGGSGGPSISATIGAAGGGTTGASGATGGGTAGGVGGTPIAGGTGGAGGDGTALTGGAGVNGAAGGGGGSGGYWGGEGGTGSAGGAGSSYVSPVAVTSALVVGGGRPTNTSGINGINGDIIIIDNETGIATTYIHTGSAQTYTIV
jgi:hypothetical protein